MGLLYYDLYTPHAGASVQSIYGSGGVPVHYSEVSCTGSESALTVCQRYLSTGSCYYYNRAGVNCHFDYLRKFRSKHDTTTTLITNNIAASPMRLQVTCQELNWCTLIWQPPSINYRRQGTILNYFVTYSIMNCRREYQTINVTRFSTSTSLRLQPYRFYNCCVAAVNEAGRGNSSCQTIISHETGKNLCSS